MGVCLKNGEADRFMRDRSIDLAKGIVVLAMIYCHIMEFFGDSQIYPVERSITTFIGVMAFPTFVYFFGRTVRLAYLNKAYLKALPRMLKTFFRMLITFYISGIFQRLLLLGKPLDANMVRQILILEAIPGSSEFIAAFALYMLLVIAAFPLLRQLCKRPRLAILPMLGCVACCFIPYDRITTPQAALLIGGTDQYYFPIVQYMPYFLAGIVFENLPKCNRWGLAGIAAAATAVSVLVAGSEWPSRFPPAWNWICLSAFIVVMIQWIAWGFLKIRGRYFELVPEWICGQIENIGAGSLAYLLYSNLFLFAVAGRRAAPKADIFQRHWFWSTPIQSPLGSLYWTCILTALIAFCIYLAGRSSPSRRHFRLTDNDKSGGNMSS